MKKIGGFALFFALFLWLAACGAPPEQTGGEEPSNMTSGTEQQSPQPSAEPSVQPTAEPSAQPPRRPDELAVGVLTPATIEFGGIERSYYYYIPSTYQPGEKLPVMVSLHGSGQNARMQLLESRWEDLAEEKGFVVLAPNAVAIHSDGKLSCEGKTSSQLGVLPANVRFNSGDYDPIAKEGVDDVAFLCALTDLFADGDGPVDPARVYASGLSNGACMAIRLAVEAPEHFAGIGSVAGLLYAQYENETPAEAMKLVFVHGTEDPIVPAGGMVYSGWVFALSLDESIEWFRGHYGLTGEPVSEPLDPLDPDDPTRISRVDYGTQGAGKIISYIVDGGGHTWPGGTQYGAVSVVGVLSKQASAAALIWAELEGE